MAAITASTATGFQNRLRRKLYIKILLFYYTIYIIQGRRKRFHFTTSRYLQRLGAVKLPDLQRKRKRSWKSNRRVQRDWKSQLELDSGNAWRQPWILLVSSSRGWENYSDEACVCALYHALLNRGVSRDRIVVMMVDEIASNPLNPLPGRIFNGIRESDSDVYGGVRIDYRGRDVTAENALRVLTGSKHAKGRVLKPSSTENVFVYLTDHGRKHGGFSFAYGGPLYPESLVKTISRMRKKNRFNEMLVAINACYSGAMLRGLRDDIGVAALFSCRADEKSWRGKRPIISYIVLCVNEYYYSLLGQGYGHLSHEYLHAGPPGPDLQASVRRQFR